MPASEIDDIFAAKGTQKAPPASSSSAPSSSKNKDKKGKKKDGKKKADKGKEVTKRKREADDENEDKPAKKRVPETVIDPSTTLALSARKKSTDTAATISTKKTSRDHRDDEARFKDSRGTGPRRKTEEGFSIYKEDELGITGQGGDTPLCPFDCQCCF
ncbi:hypothetical protein C8Q75DRAFT_750060 [Abortiporus biennis]|nr:hypothetical protein C8Q75DRAFT_750060 [Abortiporus biennis]